MLRRKRFNLLATNIEYSNSETRAGNHREANSYIVTKANIAYKSVHATGTEMVPVNAAELEVVYDTAETQVQQSTESMEHNLAYESFTDDKISLGPNIAYNKSDGVLSEESDRYEHINDDQYEYIYS